MKQKALFPDKNFEQWPISKGKLDIDQSPLHNRIKKKVRMHVDEEFENITNEPIHDGIAATRFNMKNDGTDQPYLDNDPDLKRWAWWAIHRENQLNKFIKGLQSKNED